MVKSSLKKSPFLVYDLIGGALVLGMVFAGLWSTFVHLPDSSGRFDRAQSEIASLNQSLRAVEHNLRSSTAELASVEAEVDERGALPVSAPVDANLHTLSRLIESNKIEMSDVDPIGQKQYPGLLELNYRIKCRSGFDAILAFLGDFESEPFWADLTKLRILGAPASMDSKTRPHNAEFVVSLFAARSTAESDVQP
ncbi:MAG: hypothetical protein DHS20C16_13540 [Phycisphaerae bacterium]|nr:MAG: hypothetical protein DHS20C16_13540 [Phycisphaerae bacterium]